MARLRESLQSELGEEAYNAAWERGKQLDLDTVVQELLDEFEIQSYQLLLIDLTIENGMDGDVAYKELQEKFGKQKV